MSNKVVICVNGILTWPGSAQAWTDSAVTWFHTHTGARAEKFEYLALPLTRRIMQRRRARNLARLIDSYKGHEIHLVGHSNGCDLICRALKQISTPVETIHLIAPATDADFGKNGLNEALSMERLGKVYVYAGEDDWPMKLAYYTGKVLSRIGLGYGSLGYNGPQNLADDDWVERRVTFRLYYDYGHSTFFRPQVFHTIMSTIALSLCTR